MAAEPIGPRSPIEWEPGFQILLFNPAIAANQQIDKGAIDASFGARLVEAITAALGYNPFPLTGGGGGGTAPPLTAQEIVERLATLDMWMPVAQLAVPDGMSAIYVEDEPGLADGAEFYFRKTGSGSNFITVEGTQGDQVVVDEETFFSINPDGTRTAYLASVLLATGGFTAATTTDALTGTDAAKGVTSNALAALWEKGSNIASAATISVGEGGFFHVTGTTTITDIDFATDKSGRRAVLVFDGILTLTHHATTLILPSGANIITAAGDSCVVVSEGSDAVRVIAYTRADGSALVAGGFTTASTTEALTGTDAAKGITPNALAAIWETGSDIASAATIAIGEGGHFAVTGTATITAISVSTDKAGRLFSLLFQGALTLTHNATSLILPGSANITTSTGDVAIFRSLGAGNVRCIAYTKATGAALVTGPAATTTAQLTGTNSTTYCTPDSVAALWEKGADIASASTISIGEGGFFHITGTTTITDFDFGTDKTGRAVRLVFDGILTLTHNASTLILPTGANIVTAAGDSCVVASEGSDAVRVVSYTRADGSPTGIGLNRVTIPVTALDEGTTSGAAQGHAETTNFQVNYETLDFDASADEYAHLVLRMPERWNEGTVKFDFIWTAASGSGTVTWGAQGVAFANDDALDAAFGTPQVVTDTLITAGDQHTSGLTPAITIAGSPGAGELVAFRFFRDVSAGTLAVDARLINVVFEFTTNALKDA